MSGNKYWLKNGIINLFQNGLTVLFGFLSFYALVRVLNKEEYGTWVLFLSVVSIVEMARNGLTQEALVKFLSVANRSDERKIVTGAFIINMVMTILISVAVIVIGPVLSSSWKAVEITEMLNLYIVVFFVSGILNQLNCIEQANLRFTGIFYSNISRQLVFFAYILYCYLFKVPTNVVLLTYVQIISIVVATIIAVLFTYKNVHFTKKIDVPWIKKIIHFGKYTFGISLSTVLSGSIDQMMLGSMLSKAASGSYNIAVRITNLTDIPTNAMGAIVYPQMSRLDNGHQQNLSSLKYVYEKSIGVILAILFPLLIFIFIFADSIIHFIASSKYEDSIPLLRVTLITCIFAPYGRQAGVILNSMNRTKFNFFIVIANAVFLIIFNYTLIRHFGVIGAAYGTLLVSIIGFVISQAYISKHYKTNILNPWVYAWKFYPEFYKKYINRSSKEKDNPV
ncbi:MAG: flippase [Niabella sp.]